MRGRLVLFGGLAVVVVAAAVYALAPRPERAGVPTAEVRREDFTRWVPADGELRAVESTPLQVPATVRRPLRIAWIAPEGTRLEPGDVAVRFDSTELEKNVEDQRAELASNRLRVRQRESRAEAELERLRREIRTAERELEHAEEFASRDPTIYSRVEIIESRIDRELAAERLEHARQELRREEALVDAELEILAIERRKIEAELEQALETLESLELKAPKAGHLLYRRRRGRPPEVGNTVFPGQTIAEIPHEGALEVEAYVLEADAGGLEPGRRARVIVESHPGRRHPATVRRVDSVAQPRFQASPVQYFTATLSLERTDPEVMKPGLGVRVEILLDDLEGVLTVPRQAVFEREQGRAVLRAASRRGPAGGSGFEEVPVTVRAAGRGRLAVEGDLEAGDRVALADPSAPGGGGNGPEEAEEPETGRGASGALPGAEGPGATRGASR